MEVNNCSTSNLAKCDEDNLIYNLGQSLKNCTNLKNKLFDLFTTQKRDTFSSKYTDATSVYNRYRYLNNKNMNTLVAKILPSQNKEVFRFFSTIKPNKRLWQNWLIDETNIYPFNHYKFNIIGLSLKTFYLLKKNQIKSLKSFIKLT